MDHRSKILVDDDSIARLVRGLRRVAVLGIKTEAQRGQPAFYVPEALAAAGIEIVPVPVYFPDVTTILGRPVHRRLVDVPGPVDLVDVFRRPSDLEAHVEDLLAARPAAVWFQSGIRNDAVAETLARAGIAVVQDRCLMVDHRRFSGG
jgi:predicted CoA-binding protein